MRNVEKRGVNFKGSIYSVKEGSIRTEYPRYHRTQKNGRKIAYHK